MWPLGEEPPLSLVVSTTNTLIYSVVHLFGLLDDGIPVAIRLFIIGMLVSYSNSGRARIALADRLLTDVQKTISRKQMQVFHVVALGIWALSLGREMSRRTSRNYSKTKPQ